MDRVPWFKVSIGLFLTAFLSGYIESNLLGLSGAYSIVWIPLGLGAFIIGFTNHNIALSKKQEEVK